MYNCYGLHNVQWKNIKEYQISKATSHTMLKDIKKKSDCIEWLFCKLPDK